MGHFTKRHITRLLKQEYVSYDAEEEVRPPCENSLEKIIIYSVLWEEFLFAYAEGLLNNSKFPNAFIFKG